MAYPDKPAAAYDYVAYQTSNPTDPLPANQVAADFAELNDSIDQTIDFLALALRSDGRLQNGSVRPESLSSGTLALITAGGTFVGAWVTATAYAVQDIVTESSKTYVCLVAHTSGTFATDLAAGKWMEIDGNDASLDGNNVFTGTNEFDGTTNFDGAVDFDAAATFDSTVDFNDAVTFDAAVDFDSTVDMTGATVTVPTATAGDDDTTAASTAFVQAAVGKVYVQKFTSVPTTVTVTSATPAVMTWTAHGLAIGQAFQVATSGTLPAGMALTTTYFIIAAGFGANSFQFSLTRGGAAINTTSTGTGTHTATPFYVPNPGMVRALGETWGGGGAGGGAAAGANTVSGGGGGAGSRSMKLILAADVAAAGVAVTIGAGGTAGAAGNNAGNAGGDTSIGVLCIGKGGAGGGAGTAATGTGGLGGLGGVAGTGDETATGAPGHSGTSAAVTTVLSAIGGVGGSGLMGGGGRGATSITSAAGSAGTGFGSGGGGGASFNSGGSVSGGVGTAGYARVVDFCNQ